MSAARVCSECGGSLAGKPPQTRTCSRSCRQKRSRRLRRQKQQAQAAGTHGPEAKAVYDVVSHDAKEQEEVAHQIMQEELRPVVREAITEDVLRAINDMVALTPKVVEKMAEDLESDDSVIRQRAYTLIAKYTIGHPAIVRPPEDEAGKQLVVNVGLPRPGEEAPQIDVPEAEEVQECVICQQEKPLSQFVSNSDRCQVCHDELQDRVRAQFGTDAD
jgi:hypothetical protein